MTPPAAQPTVDVIETTELRLVEEPPPRLSLEHQEARDRVWDELSQANPALFDGPVVACTSLDRSDPHELIIGWTRVPYRNFALRKVPGASPLPSLFVDALQPAHNGSLLVARMSPATAHPGRWHLPGGSVEQPDADKTLDRTALQHNAARELLEELGTDTPPSDLTLWAVTRGGHGNIGVHFSAPPQTAAALHDGFASVVTAAASADQTPELDQIAFIQTPADLTTLEGPHVDYLEPLVDRYTRILRQPPPAALSAG